MKLGKLDVNNHDKGNLTTVTVHSNEGIGHPHVHIARSNGKPDICVSLKCNKYFIHGIHKDKFSGNEQCKKFDAFMSSHMPGTDMTRWEYACLEWDIANPDYKMKDCPDKMPSYKSMTDSIKDKD